MKKIALLLSVLVLTIACSRSSEAPSAERLGAAASPGQVGPFVIPPSWKQASWFIDPQNTSTCASDNNRTCSLSTCGTSGDGPCLTFGSVATRWGTYSPRLRQNTTMTFMTSQTAGDADPVRLSPYLENLASMFVVGTTTVNATGTLGTITAKNRATPQILNSVLVPVSGSIVAEQLMIVTGAHSGEAWIYKDVAGTTWALSQPLAPAQSTAITGTPIFGTVAAEQDSFTAGDNYTTVTFPSVAITDLEPQVETWGGAGVQAGLYVSNITISTVGGITPSPLIIGDSVMLADVNVLRMVSGSSSMRASQAQGSSNFGYNQELYNCWLNGGVWPMGISITQTATISASTFYAGGVVTGGNQNRLGNASLNQDIYLGSGAHGLNAISSGNAVGIYVEASNNLALIGPGSFSTSSFIWGPGSIVVFQNSRLNYPAGATGAATNLIFTGGTTVSGQTTGCIGTTTVGSPTLTCNITYTAAHLDTNLGAVSGCLYAPGGGAICNIQ